MLYTHENIHVYGRLWLWCAQFSDFRHFVDNSKESLKDKKVLMYCTGGVRCERASSYMKLNGVESVFQLSGGIHAYQEAFPNGGFFKGKNFVYDRRIAIPYKHLDEVVGVCRLCAAPYDDYKPQVRCVKCRMLQLVCESCRTVGRADVDIEEVEGGLGGSNSNDDNNSSTVDENGNGSVKIAAQTRKEVEVICKLCSTFPVQEKSI